MALSKIGTDGIDTAATPTVASATVTGDLTVDTNTLYVDSTNNRVGIGKSTGITDKLHIENTGANCLLSVARTDGAAGRLVMQHTSSVGALQTTGSVPLVFGTNDIERMRIDSSGRVTMPYQPVFSGNRDGLSIQYNTGGIIDFTPLTNTGNHFSTSTNRFTCPVAGNYFVSTFNLTNWNGTTSPTDLKIRKNGTDVFIAYNEAGASGSYYHNHGCSGVIACAANDIIDFYYNSGTLYNGQYCGATVYLIG